MKNVGGQAVLEGVMMRGSHCVATSVRTPQGIIETLTEPIQYSRSAVRRVPVLRGILQLADSLVTGLRVMNYSASLQEEEQQGEPSFFYRLADRLSGGRAEKVSQMMTLGASFGLALFFFTVLPTLAARFLLGSGGRLTLNILEALFKLVSFILYLLGISRIPEIRRVFKYHGAEHKAIDAYEHNLPLTVENVRRSSRYHARCGTNFLFLVLIVSIAVFSMVPSFHPLTRVAEKILLIPVVSGLTYELILWLGASDSALSKAVSLPGKLLQRITTAEPDDSMIEVAITALKRSENLPYTIKELKAYADANLKGLEGAALDRDVILSHVTGLDRTAILAYPETPVSFEDWERFKECIAQRKNRRPVSYITGHKEFMGLDFLVDEATLIPRPDTEILVEAAASFLKGLDTKGEAPRILDLCSGSGAIGLAMASLVPESRVTLADISAQAMAMARKNAEKFGMLERSGFFVGDLFDAVQTADNFHVIVSNPPYIRTGDMRQLPRDVREYEPKAALDGGDTGLIFYERIADKARQYIVADGALFLEIGSDQAAEVTLILKRYGWQDLSVLSDLAGSARVIRAAWARDL